MMLLQLAALRVMSERLRALEGAICGYLDAFEREGLLDTTEAKRARSTNATAPSRFAT